MGAYAGAARRRVHLATVLLRPPFGHRPGKRQARHAQSNCTAAKKSNATKKKRSVIRHAEFVQRGLRMPRRPRPVMTIDFTTTRSTTSLTRTSPAAAIIRVATYAHALNNKAKLGAGTSYVHVQTLIFSVTILHNLMMVGMVEKCIKWAFWCISHLFWEVLSRKAQLLCTPFFIYKTSDNFKFTNFFTVVGKYCIID